MKILVTGGAGFIGSHIVDLYLEHGHEVVVVDDLSKGKITNLNPEAIFYKMDIRSRDLEEVFQNETPDVVNHHAAQVNGDDSVQNLRLFSNVNVLGSMNLIEQSIHHGVKKFIFASPGLLLYGVPEYVPCDEDHTIVPSCQYAAGKWAVEQFLQEKHDESGLEYVIFRYANVYGPRQNPQGLHGTIAAFVTDMLTGGNIYIRGEGEDHRDFIYVDDCAYANLLALDFEKSGIYNLGSGAGCTAYTILTILKTLTGNECLPTHTDPIRDKTYKIILDTRKIAQDFGWKPATGIYEGLEKTVQFYKEYCRVV